MYKITNQSVIFPWNGRHWKSLVGKVTAKLSNISELDSIIYSLYMQDIRPNDVSNMMTKYFAEESSFKKEYFMEEIIPFMQDLIKKAPKTFKKFDPSIFVPNSEGNMTDRKSVV